MQRVAGDPSCIQKFKPVFQSALYDTKVDVVGKHLNGRLSLEKMADSSVRMQFSNAVGIKFFDFLFSPDSGFKVNYILKQMDKKAVLITLQKDFELVLLYHTDGRHAYTLKDSAYYYAFPQEKGINYYIVDSSCSHLIGMQRASKRKPVVEAIMQDWHDGLPDTIGITHQNFNFTIGLKRVKR